MNGPFLMPVVLSFLWVIVIGTVIGLTRFYLVGTKKFSYDTLIPGQAHGPKWYAYLNRVYINSIEALTLFAPMVILTLGKGAQVELLVKLAWVFFLGRAVYTFIYVSGGYKIWCSFAWLVGFGATLIGWLMLLA